MKAVTNESTEILERKVTDIEKKRKSDQGSLHFAKIEMLNELRQKIPNQYQSDEAEDTLIYGLNISHLTMKHKIKEGVVFIKPNDENSLIFLDQKKGKSLKINLYKLSDITFGKNSGNFKLNMSKLTKIKENFCLTIHLNNLKYFDLIFNSQVNLDLFLLGIITFLERNINNSKVLKSDYFSLKKIWKEYDLNHSKFLNLEQFSHFLTNINFTWKQKSQAQIFQEIDTKKEGKIRFKDFISFYELIVTGEEFREVFQKYSSDPNKKYITMRGIMDFLEKEQNTKMTVIEIFAIITKFSKKTKKLRKQMMMNQNEENKEGDNALEPPELGESMLDLYDNHPFGKTMIVESGDLQSNIPKNSYTLSFRDFVNFLIDKTYNSVFNQQKFGIHQNMDLPINDYFIYSSHNTYLTGKQMIGSSSVEMYKHVLKNGCRLIEFDCWDGKTGPIITHWHFPVSKLDFRDVLINVKEYAFKKSEYPVIISVENHCSPPFQFQMQQMFVEILEKENLFILDPQNPPLLYPSPNELKRKFIIKCKRKRIFGNFKPGHEGSDNNVIYHRSDKNLLASLNNDVKYTTSQEFLGSSDQPDGNAFLSSRSLSNSNKNPTSNVHASSHTANEDSNKKNHILKIIEANEVIEEVNSVNSPLRNTSFDYDGADRVDTEEDPNINTAKLNQKSCKFMDVIEENDRNFQRSVINSERQLPVLNIESHNSPTINPIVINNYKRQRSGNVHSTNSQAEHISNNLNTVEKNLETEVLNNSNLPRSPNLNVNLNLNLNVNRYNITNNIFVAQQENKGNLRKLTNTGSLHKMGTLQEEEKNVYVEVKPNIKYVEEKEVKLNNLNIELKDPEILDGVGNEAQEKYEYQDLVGNEILDHITRNLRTSLRSNGKRKSIHSLESDSIDKNEVQIAQPTTSTEVLKKLKIKYSVDEQVASPNDTITPRKVNFTHIDAANVNYNPEIGNSTSELINRIQEIQTLDQLNPNKIIIKTIEELAILGGMLGVKYKKEHFESSRYLPWECISISEPDFEKYIQNTETRIKIIKLCQKGFLKIYPDIFRTDSTNHDPLKCWASGVQIAALNLQKTDDDWILLNKIFFKINGGSKSGYILKPELLRNPNCDEGVRSIYLKPAFSIKFKILSGFHLHLCFPTKTKISGVMVEASLRSPFHNSENAVKLVTDTISNNFLHPVWKSNSVQFDIYDPDLSFIIVKVYSKKKLHVLARSVIPVSILNLGFRVLDLYDSSCSKFDQSFLTVRSNKIILN